MVPPVPGQGDRPAGKFDRQLRFGTLNVGTLSGRLNEVVEMLSRRKVDICCVQETRWRGGSARMAAGNDTRFKIFWNGEPSGLSGVVSLLTKNWSKKCYL